MSADRASSSPRSQSVDDSPRDEYLSIGRVNQKLRTRDALVAVAVEMIRRGVSISVTDVADAARVSRTTAYRYFPTSELLAAHATLQAAGDSESQHLHDVAIGPGESRDKLEQIIVGSDAMTAAHEAAYRSMLRLSLDASNEKGELIRRPAYRRKWLEDALADTRSELGAPLFNRLTAALSLFCGIEAFVVLQDICHLKPEEAREVKRWAAQTLLQSALAEGRTAATQRALTPAGRPQASPPASSSARRKK